MRITILALCALLAAGVFATALLALYGSRPAADCDARLRRSTATELVWTLIPFLMMLAAAIPAAVAVIARGTQN
jgi:heme/copper-type cytochrome/quinol oxidase subunit 2